MMGKKSIAFASGAIMVSEIEMTETLVQAYLCVQLPSGTKSHELDNEHISEYHKYNDLFQYFGLQKTSPPQSFVSPGNGSRIQK